MGELSVLRVMLDDGAIEPTRAHPEDAGLDLYTPYMVMVPSNGRVTIDTGVHVIIPEGYVGKLESKSGLMKNHGITTRGTIDSGYLGTIQVVVFNHGKDLYTFNPGDKITQLVIYPIETPKVIKVGYVGTSKRGSNGCGSTGR